MPGPFASDVTQREDLSPTRPAWPRPDDFPRLDPRAVHVWRLRIPAEPLVGINDTPARLERVGLCLAPDEQARAARYHFAADRRRFAWTRGVLRALLAPYVGTPPGRIHFASGAKGKLRLTPPDAGVRFNVSHSHEWALIALARDREVGVDVEHHRPLHHDLFGIATRFFAPWEVAALRALPPEAREPAFFRIWSRKEAYIKATGEGVSAGLDTFEVSSGPEDAVTLRVHGRPAEDARWRMRSLDVGSDYGAAICVEGDDAELQQWEW